VDWDIVWEVVQKELVPLRTAIEKLVLS